MSKARLAALGLTAAVGLVATYEGIRQNTYRDAVGIPTICYGHTGTDVRMGQRATMPECQALLESDILIAYEGIRKCTNVRLTDGERAAYTSFVFNVGVGAYCKSRLVRMVNAGDRRAACFELLRWTYAGGRQLPGLVNRRKSEHQLCLRDLP